MNRRVYITIENIRNSACGKLNAHLFHEKQEIKKQSKYRNTKKIFNGIEFDSAKEAGRYRDLLILEAAKVIRDLKLQVSFDLSVNGRLICRYVADFTYFICKDNQYVVEDVKSAFTRKLRVYLMKKKLMKEIHGIEIKEV